MRDFPPTHPGEILLEEFLKPMGITNHAQDRIPNCKKKIDLVQ